MDLGFTWQQTLELPLVTCNTQQVGKIQVLDQETLDAWHCVK
jgi:hypothetical protein